MPEQGNQGGTTGNPSGGTTQGSENPVGSQKENTGSGASGGTKK